MKFKIKGMHCKSCKMLIEDVLDDLNVDIISFSFDESRQEGILEVTGGSEDKIVSSIKAEGDYEVVRL